MSKLTKITVSAAIILSTAFAALAANAGASREQGASSGTGVAAYDGHGGIVSGRWR